MPCTMWCALIALLRALRGVVRALRVVVRALRGVVSIVNVDNNTCLLC